MLNTLKASTMRAYTPVATKSRDRSALKVVAFAPDSRETTKVKFSIKQKIEFGRHIAVVGSLPVLGEWNPVNSLSLEWIDDAWEQNLELPVGEKVEFKFVIADDSGVEWSNGANLVIEVPAAEVLVEVARWDDPTLTVSETTITAPPKAADNTAKPTESVLTASIGTHQSPTIKEEEKEAPPSSSYENIKLESLTVPKLKALAVEIGVATGGKKADLVKRLKEALNK